MGRGRGIELVFKEKVVLVVFGQELPVRAVSHVGVILVPVGERSRLVWRHRHEVRVLTLFLKD